ncbi:hypothetical protein SteCoe_12471 [Stentor coeruleus]|uniref:Uncharacterized protein n=1 Tax=Stentor coeruleus TaxID=5963 RepID=A0A1R2CAT5_9CILI|nr:hypothetical protein SteCoe_12471 [Stentor coeruleus]
MGCGTIKPDKRTGIKNRKSLCDADFLLLIKTRFTFQCNENETICHRFPLPEEMIKVVVKNPEILKLDRQSSSSNYFTKKLSSVFKDYLQFCNIEGYFSLCLHKVCLKQYNLSLGIIVMYVTILANCDKVKIIYKNPYIEVENKDLCIIKAWKDYVQMVENAYEAYVQQGVCNDLILKIRKRIRKIQNLNDRISCKRKKYLTQAQELIEKFINNVEASKNTISDFFKCYKKLYPSLQELVKIAKENKLTTCEKIVHFIIKKQ